MSDVCIVRNSTLLDNVNTMYYHFNSNTNDKSPVLSLSALKTADCPIF